MKSWKIGIILTLSMGVFAACGEDTACDSANLCPVGKVCANSKCIDRCNATSCSSDEACSYTGLCLPKELVECSDYVACADSTKTCEKGHCVGDDVECSAEKPCTNPNLTCVGGQCVSKANDPECSENNPCSGGRPCVGGVCQNASDDGTCSPTKPCGSGKTCVDRVCKVISEIVCYSDRECGDGYICDTPACIPEDACSPTRKCKDSRVCQNGVCIDMPKPVCSKDIACPEASQTCVAGQCVVCQCEDDESCQPDGSCLSKKHSDVKNVDVGDPCDWRTYDTACDGNRVVLCSQTVGQEESPTVKMSDCGVNICAEASDDGVNCYEPCTHEGDFYGECFQDYNSESGTIQGIAFNSVCEKTSSGQLIWTFSGAPQFCEYQCVDGNCVFIPEEYGSACALGDYKDKCVGDWLVFCDKAQGYNGGVVYAENCADYYHNAHRCALDADGVGSCVTECKEENSGNTKDICTFYLESSWYSDHVTCKPDENGNYYWFSDDYTSCSPLCDVSTGLCQ